jgi:hypothetical protein
MHTNYAILSQEPEREKICGIWIKIHHLCILCTHLCARACAFGHQTHTHTIQILYIKSYMYMYVVAVRHISTYVKSKVQGSLCLYQTLWSTGWYSCWDIGSAHWLPLSFPQYLHHIMGWILTAFILMIIPTSLLVHLHMRAHTQAYIICT